MNRPGERRPRIFTIGHSNLSMEVFLRMLEASSIRLVADIRSNPASSRFPHFERHFLANELESRGIAYRWFRDLGGRVSASIPGEENHTALDDPALRRYAAWLSSPGARDPLEGVMGLAASTVAVLLCAERDFRNCHRRILSDRLHYMGIRVVHILDSETAVPHPLHPDLQLHGDRLLYFRRQLPLIE